MNHKERVICEFGMDCNESFLIELWSKNDDLVSTYTRYENGYGFKTLGLKTGVENDIFLSEVG